MIILDECIDRDRIIAHVSRWYPGQVTSIVSLRPNTLVKDEAIPTLLQRVTRPTFLTINVDDFWLEMTPHPGYCIVAAVFRQEESPSCR